MKNAKKGLLISSLLFLAFVLWTVIVMYVDVGMIGADGTSVGLSTLNGYVHSQTGVNFALYDMTDVLSSLPLMICVGFGALGLFQLIKRKRISAVDGDIICMGVFYVTVIGVFLFFENFTVNYRPVLIEGQLEVSYPSSTTLLVMCVVPSAVIWSYRRIQNKILKNTFVCLGALFTAFMVVCRLVSGVHWFTDIVGGILISASLVTLYGTVSDLMLKNHIGR